MYDMRDVESTPLFKSKVLLDADAILTEYFDDPIFADLDYTEWIAETGWLVDGYYQSRWIQIRPTASSDDRIMDIHFTELDQSEFTVEMQRLDDLLWVTLSPPRVTEQSARFDLSAETSYEWVKVRIGVGNLSRLNGFVIKEP